MATPSHPNIIFVLTDDQDTVLGGDGARAMPRGLPALSRRGATLENWFVHTPVCAASRAQILTGRYFHNLADVPAADDPWDKQGNTKGPCFASRPNRGCGPPSSAPGRNMHLNFSMLSPGPTFAQHLAQRAGYNVGVFGKYLNRNPMSPLGQPVIPAGVSHWFVAPGDEANKSTASDPSGEYFPSFYYDSREPSGMWNNSDAQYETALLGNRSISWLREAATDPNGRPFFLYLAPHSPHGSALPAPWYTSLNIKDSAPRTPSWNVSATDHHWLIAKQPPLSMNEAAALDRHFQDRWRCLRATDDLLAALEAELSDLALWNSTYVFFSADHGYHFGELRLGGGKWNVYDTDIRVPMRIIGPGIQANTKLGMVGSHVDLAPTWLELAGLDVPADMDGRSLVRGLLEDGPSSKGNVTFARARMPASPVSVRESGGALPLGGAYIEYHGLGPTGATSPPFFRQQDSFNNTYRALRVIDRRTGGLGNVLYAEFGTFNFTTIYTREFFDIDDDPWQQRNRYATLAAAEKAAWATRVSGMFHCSGATCSSSADVQV